MKKVVLHTWFNNIWEEIFPETYSHLIKRVNKPDVETSLTSIETSLTTQIAQIQNLYTDKLYIKPNGIDLLIVDGKVNTVYIPDVILGQLQYGGAFNSSDIVTGSPYSSLIGTNLNIVSPATIAGFYFLYQGPTTSHTFKGDEYNVGDWAVCNGAVTNFEWSKIDNTDAVTGVKGNAETVYRKGQINLTAANIGAVDKTGDTMTGSLNAPSLCVNGKEVYSPSNPPPATVTPTGSYPNMRVGTANNADNADNAEEAVKLSTARTIDGVPFDGSAGINHYSTCSTSASTAAKTVTKTGFVLATGARITVKFTYANTANTPTLNVNNTGAFTIKDANSNTLKTYSIKAGDVIDFEYDGSYWVALNIASPKYTTVYEVSSTGTGQKTTNYPFSKFDMLLFISGDSSLKSTLSITPEEFINYNSNNNRLVINYYTGFVNFSYDNDTTFTIRDKSGGDKYFKIIGIKY